MTRAHEDDARLLPQGRREQRYVGKPRADDEAYVIDTRKRARPRSRAGRPAPPPRGPRRRPDAGARADRPAKHTRRRGVVLGVGLIVVAWLAFMVWVPFHAWHSVSKIDAVPAGQRPTAGGGHNYLLVGSDSRAGLTTAQKKALTTGNAAGQRTDSIILIHVPGSGGKAAVISIPRDSYVPIPGHHSNKINASYAMGGPKLLVSTVEHATDVHIDGFVEIGFAGFANVVDSLGGVNICVPFHMNDKKAGINLQKGCQNLDGANALGFVRARYSDPRGDIGRAQRQRQFLGAVMKKAATPSTVLLPWRYYGFSMAAASGVRVGQDTSMSDMVKVLQAMRGVSKGEALSLTVPIATESYQTAAGTAIKWDTTRARSLFGAIRADKPLTVAPAGTDGRPTGG